MICNVTFAVRKPTVLIVIWHYWENSNVMVTNLLPMGCSKRKIHTRIWKVLDIYIENDQIVWIISDRLRLFAIIKTARSVHVRDIKKHNMSINELVIRGSTSISLHERFTSLKRPGQTSQGHPANDSLNDSGYNRSGYGDDHSVGPALRAATSVPSYTPAVRAEQYNRGGYFRSGNTGQSSQPYYERYNPEQVLVLS